MDLHFDFQFILKKALFQNCSNLKMLLFRDHSLIKIIFEVSMHFKCNTIKILDND